EPCCSHAAKLTSGRVAVQRRGPLPASPAAGDIHLMFTVPTPYRTWLTGQGGTQRGTRAPVGYSDRIFMARILLAEDDDDMRRFLVKALERAGYDVSDFDNGASAYERLREEPFSLLLTDIV